MVYPNEEQEQHHSVYTRFGYGQQHNFHGGDQNSSTNSPNLQSMEIIKNSNNDDFNDVDDYDYDDEEIQRDAASDRVAFIVYIALGFFMTLFFGVTVAIIIIVGNYGFVVLMILSVLLFMVMMLIKITLYYMEQDKVLRPMKKKMRRWHAIATAVVVNELKNFHLDLNDHLLLTYDENYQDGDDYDDNVDDSGNDNKSGGKRRRRWRGRRGGKRQRGGGPRSKIFGLLVQPLLKKKKHQSRFGMKKKTENNLDTDGTTVEDHAIV